MNQIALPLDTAVSADDGDYVVTEPIAEIDRQLHNWRNWPHLTAILVGPPASGKSTMARWFVSDSGGLCLDDAAGADDEEIFHLWNRAREEAKPLLLVSSRPVASWGVTLPDLKSRLASSIMLEIAPPDQAMIEGLMQKYFVQRGLSISEEALTYLGKRMERSYFAVQKLAEKMDELAIERKKSITLAIARAALEQGLEDGLRDDSDG